MQGLLGIIFHFFGGFASGSFYMPYKKVRGWSWETFWLVGGLFSWLIVPPIAAAITIPGFALLIQHAPVLVLQYTILFGILWGVGGLTYGLGVRFLGMSLGNTVILGCCAAFGALMPALYYNFFPIKGKTSITDLLSSPGGRMILIGIGLCLVGIAVCGFAGFRKEKELVTEAKKDGEFRLGRGLVLALVSGILSACFNFGIEAGKPLADAALAAGCNPLYQNNIIFVVILWGGLATNAVYCIVLNIKRHSGGEYVDTKKPLTDNYFYCGMAGTLWFLQFFFYGMGASKLGNGASSWILHMSFIILVANGWGLSLKEWSGVSARTKKTIIAGIAIILGAVILVGVGNSK